MFSNFSITKLLTLTIVICISFVNFEVLSQEVPSIACPHIFQYLSYGNNYIGKITLSGLPVTSLKVEAQFSQRQSITNNYSGRLSLTDSLQETQNNLQSGQPISYRVDFPNPHLLPKLIRIKINEQTICSDYGFPAPSTTFSIHHSFYPSSTTLSRLPQPNRVINVFGEDLNGFDEDFNSLGTFPGQSNFGQQQPNFVQQQPNFVQQQPNFGQNTNNWPIFATTPTTQRPTPRPTPRPTQQPSSNNPFLQNMPTAAPATTNLADICGQEGSSLTPFIVGGHDFERGRFPWLTAIYTRQSADLKFTCGGSLISTRTVVTAAHCFIDSQISADRIVVYLGRHNLYSSEIGVEQRDIQTMIRHPEFNTSNMSDADIALLQMRVPLSFTQFIRPICLWSSSSFSNNAGFVAGWGADHSGLDVTPVPKMVETTIVSEAECLRSSDVFRTLTSSRSLCAGNRDGTGPCIGDSGGGLMVNSGGRWTLRAVTSLGITDNKNNRKACKLDEFVVYCDLSKHMSWLRRNMLP